MLRNFAGPSASSPENSSDSSSDPDQISDNDIHTTLDRLFSYYPLSIDMGLERVYTLLERLGNPHLNLPPVIHVAGTNGKGSTLAFLRAILEAAGKRVHAFTSPHLMRYNERVVLAGREIDNSLLYDVLTRCEAANDGDPITFFEITSVASFLAFSETPADVVLLETGMGGRLDATNVVPDPALCLITAISYDHAQFLGPTLPQIAAEKSGILKQGAVAALGYQSPVALESGVDILFENKAKELDILLARGGTEWRAWKENDILRFEGFNRELSLPLPVLPGPHQIHNAGLAVAGLCALEDKAPEQWKIPLKAYESGMRQAFWPARLQHLTQSEKAFGLDQKNCELWLDGGHNDSAGMAIAGQAALWEENDKKELHLIMGMLNTKQPEDFIRPLLPFISSITCIEVPDEPASFSANELCARLKDMESDCKISTSSRWSKAVRQISETHYGARILTCGSLYLAGRVLSECEASYDTGSA